MHLAQITLSYFYVIVPEVDSRTLLPKGNKNVCFKSMSHEHDAMILLAFSSNPPPQPPVLKDSPTVLLPHDTAVDLL